MTSESVVVGDWI